MLVYRRLPNRHECFINTLFIMKLNIPIGLSLVSMIASLSCANNSDRDSSDTLPNIVLIYVDDMGYGDLSLTGAYGFKTPNLDRMAAEGMFFSQFYAPQAVCSASRAGIAGNNPFLYTCRILNRMFPCLFPGNLKENPGKVCMVML